MRLTILRRHPLKRELYLLMTLLICFGPSWMEAASLLGSGSAAAQGSAGGPTPILVAPFQPQEGVPSNIASRFTSALMSTMEKSRQFTASRLSLEDPTLGRLIHEQQITEAQVTGQLERPSAEGLAEIAYAARIPLALFGEVESYQYDPSDNGKVTVGVTAHFVGVDLTTGAVSYVKDLTAQGVSKPQLKPVAEETLAAQALYDASENLLSEFTGKPRPPEVKPRPKGLSGLAIVAGVAALALIAGQQGRKRAPFAPPVAANAPRNVRAVPFGNLINLTWEPPAAGSPSGYHIYRGEVGAASRGRQVQRLTIGAPVPAATTSYTDTTAQAGTLYVYFVTAVYPDGSESGQVPANVGTTGQPTPVGIGVPLPPVNLQGLAGDTVAILSWSDHPDNPPGLVAGYRLYRATNPQMTGAILVADESVLRAANRAFTDTGLTNGQPYYYAVAAVGVLGYTSARSSVIAVTPGNVRPQAPALLNAQWDPTIQVVRLSWSASPDPDIQEYKIYRKAESFTRSRSAVSRLRSPTILPNLPPGVAQQLLRRNPPRQAVQFTEADRIATVAVTNYSDAGAAQFVPRAADSQTRYSTLLYAVKAVDRSGQESDFSPVAQVVPNNPPPSLENQAPQVVPGNGKNTIIVEALLQSAEADTEWRVDQSAVRILRSTTPGGTATGTAITPQDPLPLPRLQTGPSGRFFDDTNVTNGATYFYAVQLVDKLGVAGIRSGEAVATPFATGTIVFQARNDITEVSGNGSHQLPITLIARDGAGRPIGGLSVQITVQPAGRGTVSPAQGRTDRQGQFQFTYTAPTSATDETVTISASTGLTNVTVTPLRLTVRAPVVGSVTIAAEKTELIADGLDSTFLTIAVQDRVGQPVGNATVSLAVSPIGSGRFVDATGRDVNQIQVGASGVGQVRFIAGTTAQRTVTVTATAEGTTISGQVVLSVVAGSPATIQLVSSPAEADADGQTLITITATVKDGNDNPVARGNVTFESTDPRVVFESTRTTTATALTNESGVATVQVTAPTRAGSYVIRAGIGPVSASVTVRFRAGAATTVVATASRTDLLVFLPQPDYNALNALERATVTVTVLDANDNAVPNAVVTATGTLGGGIITPSAITDGSGRATLEYTSPRTPQQDTVTITAGTGSATLTFNVLPGPPARVQILQKPESLPPDGVTTADVLVRVLDGQGNPVKDGVPVVFSADEGFPSSGSWVPGNVREIAVSTSQGDGTARATLMAGSSLGVVRIAVRASETIEGTLFSATEGFKVPVGGTLESLTLSANELFVSRSNAVPRTPFPGKPNSIQVTVTMRDADGTGVPNQRVTLNSSDPNTLWQFRANSALMTIDVTTDSNGQASATFYSSTRAHDVTITATFFGQSRQATVTQKPGPPDGVTITSDQPILFVNLDEGFDPNYRDLPQTAQLTVLVADLNGNPIPDSLVTLTCDIADSLSVSSGLVGADGVLRSTFSAPRTIPPASARVTASVVTPLGERSTQGLTLQIRPGPPAQMNLSATATTIRVGESTTILADVTDANGHRVIDGLSVTFRMVSAPAGTTLSPTVTSTSSGQAATTLTAGSVAGTATVEAEVVERIGSHTFRQTRRIDITIVP